MIGERRNGWALVLLVAVSVLASGAVWPTAAGSATVPDPKEEQVKPAASPLPSTSPAASDDSGQGEQPSDKGHGGWPATPTVVPVRPPASGPLRVPGWLAVLAGVGMALVALVAGLVALLVSRAARAGKALDDGLERLRGVEDALRGAARGRVAEVDAGQLERAVARVSEQLAQLADAVETVERSLLAHRDACRQERDVGSDDGVSPAARTGVGMARSPDGGHEPSGEEEHGADHVTLPSGSRIGGVPGAGPRRERRVWDPKDFVREPGRQRLEKQSAEWYAERSVSVDRGRVEEFFTRLADEYGASPPAVRELRSAGGELFFFVARDSEAVEGLALPVHDNFEMINAGGFYRRIGDGRIRRIVRPAVAETRATEDSKIQLSLKEEGVVACERDPDGGRPG